VTIRPDGASAKAAPHRRAGLVLLGALALLAALVLAATATASSGAPSARRAAASATINPKRLANPKATASVIGGHNARIDQFPSLAFIEGAEATTGYACTGTVVAPRVVLTAGHCVEDLESSSITEPKAIAVATGISNLEHIPADKVSPVTQVLAYPGFNPTKLHGDAGLLILAAPVEAPPIALATAAEGSLYEPGHRLTIAGWGVDDRLTGHAPNQLQTAQVPIEQGSRCQRGVRRFYPFFDPERQLCTLDTPQLKITTCHGDSGGPAIARRADGSMVEVGITSLGDGTCNPTSPAVFTRTDRISTWVQHWIDAVEAGGPTPRIVVPEAHLPLLTRERSEELGFLSLIEGFGPRFTHGQEQTFRCERLAKARVKCGVTWWQGPNDYFGTVNVFFAIRHNVVLAGVHYTVQWVDDQCYFHGSHHPAVCRVHTKRR
jgi:V8-like Glu-specific endopeptidase